MTFDEEFVDMDTSQFSGNDLFLLSVPYTYNLYELTLRHHTMSCMQMNIKVVRGSRFYQLNVIMVMFVLCSLVTTAWEIHPADISSRHDVDFNLILTIVAFKLILVSMLPPVSYVTMLDVYVLVGFFYVTGATAVHSLLPWQIIKMTDDSPLTLPPLTLLGEEELLKKDRMIYWIFVGIWTVFNVGYFTNFYLHSKRNQSRFIQKALDEQAKFDRQHREMADHSLSSEAFRKACNSKSSTDLSAIP